MRVIVLLAMCVFSTTYGGTVVFVQSGEKDATAAETSLTCPDGSVCPGIAACCRTYLNKYHCCAYPTVSLMLLPNMHGCYAPQTHGQHMCSRTTQDYLYC